jgi:hypothetical protein
MRAHEDFEPTRNAALSSAVVFKTASKDGALFLLLCRFEFRHQPLLRLGRYLLISAQ